MCDLWMDHLMANLINLMDIDINLIQWIIMADLLANLI